MCVCVCVERERESERESGIRIHYCDLLLFWGVVDVSVESSSMVYCSLGAKGHS